MYAMLLLLLIVVGRFNAIHTHTQFRKMFLIYTFLKKYVQCAYTITYVWYVQGLHVMMCAHSGGATMFAKLQQRLPTHNGTHTHTHNGHTHTLGITKF